MTTTTFAPYTLPGFIESYAKHVNQVKEGYSLTDTKIWGMTLGVFIAMGLLYVILFVITAVLLVRHHQNMPGWAVGVGWFSLLFLPFGAVIAIALAYVHIDNNGGKKMSRRSR